MNTNTFAPARAPSDVAPRLIAALNGKVDLLSNVLRKRISTLPAGRATPEDLEALGNEIVTHVVLFAGEKALDILRELDGVTASALELFPRSRVVPIEHESAVVEARKRAGAIATRLGFRAVQRTKIVTAASELARNIHMYVGKGEVEIQVLLAPRSGIVIHARDQGCGIPNVADVFAGRLQSKRGMGMGLRGVKGMADEFEIASQPGLGTSVRAVFYIRSYKA